ncbi:hypothetical protein D3C76_1567050 [compost metagenome]
MSVPPDGIANTGQGEPVIKLSQPTQHGQAGKQGSEQEEGAKPQAEQGDYLLFLVAIEDLVHDSDLN